MAITHRTIGPVVILELTGTLGAGTDAEFLDKVRSNLYEGYRAFAINLSSVKHVDSTGLGTLLHTHGAVARSGGRMVLANVTQRIRSVMAIAKLVTVFDVFDAEDAAIAALAGAAPMST
jgi:anti-sigma B factor antagonist